MAATHPLSVLRYSNRSSRSFMHLPLSGLPVTFLSERRVTGFLPHIRFKQLGNGTCRRSFPRLRIATASSDGHATVSHPVLTPVPSDSVVSSQMFRSPTPGARKSNVLPPVYLLSERSELFTTCVHAPPAWAGLASTRFLPQIVRLHSVEFDLLLLELRALREGSYDTDYCS
ncbi:MAG: hypothetical protein OXF02_07185 [Simkaniaceae bacterium]|nr:hypothetical protein [Simkaniaceae bacterium]